MDAGSIRMTVCNAYSPIGVFDSGVGGLTVCRQLCETLPAESIAYLGDTARVPYGSKSAATVIRYALSCASLLVSRDIKLLVVACNTASAFALNALRKQLRIPVIGVVEPGARAACQHSVSGRIGVIGTRGVIGSEVYPDTIRSIRPESQVFAAACPLFVPFAEEGWLEGDAIESVAAAYLTEILSKNIDVLVLGCTHYPLLRSVIAKTAGTGVRLVDSAEETAKEVAYTLKSHGINTPAKGPAEHCFLVSDAPELFAQTGARFFGRPFDHVEWVDVCSV